MYTNEDRSKCARGIRRLCLEAIRLDRAASDPTRILNEDNVWGAAGSIQDMRNELGLLKDDYFDTYPEMFRRDNPVYGLLLRTLAKAQTSVYADLKAMGEVLGV